MVHANESVDVARVGGAWTCVCGAWSPDVLTVHAHWSQAHACESAMVVTGQ